MVLHRYLGMYPVVNGEADEVDGYNTPILISDAELLANILSTFWYLTMMV